MQSLSQDVKYYVFFFVISFLDVNIVVNTNLYLKNYNSSASFLPHYHPGAASGPGWLVESRKCFCVFVRDVRPTEKVSVLPNKL